MITDLNMREVLKPLLSAIKNDIEIVSEETITTLFISSCISGYKDFVDSYLGTSNFKDLISKITHLEYQSICTFAGILMSKRMVETGNTFSFKDDEKNG